jgi:hypothetical protein
MRRGLITTLLVLLVGAGTAMAATSPPRNTVRPTISGTARHGKGVPAGAEITGAEITFPSGATTAFATQALCARNSPGRKRSRKNLACSLSPL